MTAVRFLLNSPFTGANAFIALADELGFFREAGLEVEFTPGRGAYTAAGRLVPEGFDAAYGDINALVELAATREGPTPSAVLMLFERTPSTITVLADGPVRDWSDLAGRKLIGHATDVALRTFAPVAGAVGLDAGTVTIETSDAPMGELIRAMQAGLADGVFGYVSTHAAALSGLGQDGDGVRFLRFATAMPAFYGSALMVSPGLLAEAPGTVRALIAAVTSGVAAMLADHEGAIDAVLKRSPAADRAVELERLRCTLREDMACSGGMRPGFGKAALPRLQEVSALLVKAYGWPKLPPVATLFDQGFTGPA